MTANMTRLEKLSHYVSITVNILVGLGVIASFCFARQTLNEIRIDRNEARIDRELRQSEHEKQLQHDAELQKQQQWHEQRPIVYSQQEYSESAIVVTSAGAIELADKDKGLAGSVPKIKNFGKGSALDITVHWKPKMILPESLAIDDPNLLKPTLGPPVPNGLSPDEPGGLYLLPACLNSPKASSIRRVIGDLEIHFSDRAGHHEVTNHTFDIHVFTGEKRIVIETRRILPFDFERDFFQ